jgi:VWFA-related protein
MMMRRRLVVSASVSVFALAGVLVAAQSRELPPAGDQPTFRVGTRLATIDAVVVDDKGRHVTDLTPADFEVVERGKSQTVRQVVYVRNVPGGVMPAPVAAPEPADPAVPGVTPAPAPRARPLAGGSGLPASERTGRVLAIVVDDLGLSFESTVSVRRMLTQYVDTKVAPGDLVAIIRTAGGVGALQQFTTDRRLLHAAIDRVRWSLQSRSGVAAFEAVSPDSSANLFARRTQQIGEPAPLLQSPDEFRHEVAAAGTLGALEYIVRGIEALPGRKSVIFVSEGFDLGIKNAKSSRTWSAFTRMMDRANRAGVVVYTIDGRGLQTAGLTAEDDPQTPKISMPGSGSTGPGGPAPTGPQLSALVTGKAKDRMTELINTQDALVYLAQQTGGLAMLNTNDLSGALDRIVDDTQGYYLIGFDTAIPGDQRWDPNDMRVRVKRDGLTVRARRGLFGPADKNLPKDDVIEDPLVTAALSPFSTGAIDVRLTTLFAHDKKAGSYVRSLFFIDPAGLTFTDGPDGRKDADLTLLVMAIGDNGQSIGQLRRQLDLRLTADEYQQLRQRGLLYSARLPIREPGGYQVRAAVRDRNSEAVGTGAQFVEVPKVGKNQVALSGVVMMDVTAASGTPTGLSTDVLADGVLGEPAIKIFRPGSEVAYTCEIYDGRDKRDEGFVTSATLIRDGRPFYTTPPSAVSGAAGDATPVGTVPVGGKLSLGRGLPRGSYTLQVSVSPHTAKAKAKTPSATQWVDFEVR